MKVTHATQRELLHKHLRRRLTAKQREMENNQRDLAAIRLSGQVNTAFTAAIRRNEKSIALLTSKLLCPHDTIEYRQYTRNGKLLQQMRCPACKTTVINEVR